MDRYLLFAIVSMFGYGITAIIYKLSNKSIDAISMSFFTVLVMVIGLGFIWLLTKDKHITQKGIEYAVFAGIIASISFLAYISSVQLGKVSVATTLRSLGFVITILLAVLFLAEKITWVKALGIGLGTASIILLSL